VKADLQYQQDRSDQIRSGKWRGLSDRCRGRGAQEPANERLEAQALQFDQVHSWEEVIVDVHRTLGSIRHSDRDQVGTERSSSAKESSLNRLCVRRIIDVVMKRRSDVAREDQGLQQRQAEAKVSRGQGVQRGGKTRGERLKRDPNTDDRPEDSRPQPQATSSLGAPLLLLRGIS
jgi:hypothetical protein